MKSRESIESLKAGLQYIDMAFLYDLVMENGEFLQNVIRQFLKQFPGEMESLEAAVAAGDKKQVATLAHHIQSTVSVLGKNTPFFQQLEKLEKWAKIANTGRQQINTLFHSLQEHKLLLMRDIDRLMKAELD